TRARRARGETDEACATGEQRPCQRAFATAERASAPTLCWRRRSPRRWRHTVAQPTPLEKRVRRALSARVLGANTRRRRAPTRRPTIMLARTPLAFLPLACALALGCDGGARAPRGYTPCGDFPSGPVECQPGQWCVDATFSECTPGCTSDLNCTDG